MKPWERPLKLDKKNSPPIVLNVLLFLILGSGMQYFFMGAWVILTRSSPFWTMMNGITWFVWPLLLCLEAVLFVELDISKKPFVRSLLLTHAPWLLGFALPFAMGSTLPEPHNFVLRKVQLLLGLIWVSHLFLFSGWLLWRVRESKKPVSTLFAWVAAFFFVGAALWTTQCDLSGDEPHYLLTTYSLIHDGDLDLTNNYLNTDYGTFYHRGVLEPQALEHVIDGKRYSHHPLGPSLVVLPGFWLLGRLGAALTMALLTALALFLTLRVLELSGAKGWRLQVVGVIGLFSSPFLLFDGLIFPEVPAACLTALTLYVFLKKRWWWLGLTLGIFLWMHNRNALLVIPFLLLIGLEIMKHQKGRMKEMGSVAAGFGIPTALLVLYFHAIYGVWTPLGAHNEAFESLFPLGHFWIGFFGLILDQECGLWFHFPIFALALTGGVILWRSKNSLRTLTLGTFLFYYLFMSFYENLGLTPATRYMVSVTPLLLFFLYPVLNKMKEFRTWEVLAIVSFLAGSVINWILAVVPWMRYNKLDGENMMLKIAGGFLHRSLTALEPAFQAPVLQTYSYVLSAFWFVLTVVLTFWFIRENVKR
jgi:hypothetical protein